MYHPEVSQVFKGARSGHPGAGGVSSSGGTPMSALRAAVEAHKARNAATVSGSPQSTVSITHPDRDFEVVSTGVAASPKLDLLRGGVDAFLKKVPKKWLDLAGTKTAISIVPPAQLSSTGRGSDTAGMFTPGRGTVPPSIRLSSNLNSSSVRLIVAHELGHAVDHNTSFSKDRGFKDALSEDLKNMHPLDKKQYDYFSIPSEAVAEISAYSMGFMPANTRSNFSKAFPRSIKALEDLVDTAHSRQQATEKKAAGFVEIFKRAPPGNDNGKGNTIPKPLPVAGGPKVAKPEDKARTAPSVDTPVDTAKALSTEASTLCEKAKTSKDAADIASAIKCNADAAKSMRAAGKATAIGCTGSEADKQKIVDQYEAVAAVHDQNLSDLSKLKPVKKGDPMYTFRGGKIVYSHLFKGARSGQPGAGGMPHAGSNSGAGTGHMAKAKRVVEGEDMRSAAVRSTVHDHMSSWQESDYGKIPDPDQVSQILERAVSGKKISINNLVDDFNLSAGKAKSLIESRKKALEPFGNSGPTQTQAQRIDAYLKQPTAGYMRR